MIKTDQRDYYYRRGVLLGMTFAELLILLLFLLLLILGSKLIDFGENQDQNATELTNLRYIVSLIKDRHGEKYNEIVDLLKAGKAEQAYELLIETSPIVQEKNVELIAKEEAVKQLDNLIKDYKAQNAYLVKSNGLTLPPCWADSDGKPQYIYSALLKDDGIWVIDNKIPSRIEDQKKLPLQDFKFNLPMQPNEFIKAGQGLKAYGNSNECRFYVRIYDKTEPHRKEYYKHLRSSVENIFYPRIEK